MKNVLAIYSSITGSNSVTNTLAKNWVSNQDASVVERDLSENPIPHLDGMTVGAFFTPADQHSEEQAELVKLSEQLISELEAADTLVISAPMYNFGIPSTLKAWIDQVARAGRTFQYTETGPVGLLTGKKAVVVTARGGMYKESGFDFQIPFVKQFLGFVGITDIEVIYAEGVAMGDEAKQDSVANAEKALEAISA